jgi:DNA-binding beta-propeller fold protein YncE
MLDSAVYIPPDDFGNPAFIVGVRGGYIFRFDPATFELLSSARFCSPSFGDSAICWDSLNNKVIVSFWNEQSSATGRGQTPSTDTQDARGLYRINPTSLVTELFASSASLGATPPQGIHNLVYSHPLGDNVYSGSPQISVFDSHLLTGTCSAPLAYYPIWTDVAVDEVNGFAYATDPIGQAINVIATTPPGALSPISTAGFNPYGICVVPNPVPAFSAQPWLYVTSRSGTVYWWQIGVSSAWTGISLGVTYPMPTPLPYHIRYNPVDGLVYVPDVQGNEVFVINPATKTVVATYPTPYTAPLDSPIDVLFTPTNVMAVQQGINGLVLIK